MGLSQNGKGEEAQAKVQISGCGRGRLVVDKSRC